MNNIHHFNKDLNDFSTGEERSIVVGSLTDPEVLEIIKHLSQDRDYLAWKINHLTNVYENMSDMKKSTLRTFGLNFDADMRDVDNTKRKDLCGIADVIFLNDFNDNNVMVNTDRAKQIAKEAVNEGVDDYLQSIKMPIVNSILNKIL